MIAWLGGVLVVGILLTQDFIDLEVAADLPGWHANLPVVDLLALLGLPLGLWAMVGRAYRPPARVAFMALAVVGVLGIPGALDPGGAAHQLLRKPLFCYVAYALGLGALVAHWAPPRWVRWGLLGWLGLVGGISLAASFGRLAAGNALWFEAIHGLTPNHKTLAVAMAGGLPLVLGIATEPSLGRPIKRVAAAAVGLALVAIVLSLSKTAWLTGALALALYFPQSRPCGTRVRWAVPALALGIVLALYAPVLLGSKAMLDAARSRHSLNIRAWEMFADQPLVGQGAGMSVQVEMATFPHYRVNGVDAHGIVQKVGGEHGALGLVAYGAFAGGLFLALRRRRLGDGRGLDWAPVATFGTLHMNLLLSTEAFSPTHWVPLGVAWGWSLRPRPGAVP